MDSALNKGSFPTTFDECGGSFYLHSLQFVLRKGQNLFILQFFFWAGFIL